jgi:hypothetical protein
MKKLYIFLISSLFVVSTWAVAEEAELLDTYLEDLPTTGSQQEGGNVMIVGQPVEVVAEENGVSREVVQPGTVKYRRIESADGLEVYEVVPSESPTSDVVVSNEAEVKSSEDLEVIELEPTQEEFVVIEAPENQSSQRVATTNAATVSGHAFCQQNPYARECLLSKYLSLCKRDPQSADCKSELHKFDKFCGTFPNAYKCKKAKIAAICKENPESGACKTFTQRYCQKYPKAIFCNYN